jgi:hypothetical protein
MASEELRYIHNIGKKLMNKYYYYNKRYYRIVGYRYLGESLYCLIIIISHGSSYEKVMAKWEGKNEILLNKSDGLCYTYDWVSYPIDESEEKIVDKKNE